MITYGSTTLTSYNTITKIEVYYYKSTSPTSLSGGSWSTTKPTWENGKYIWQKIRTTYEGKLENGQFYSESDPVNITGQQGQQGVAGTSAYSYKLTASDTIVTISKTGVYSTNSITFSATSKQGTENVTEYSGRFKIETTSDGITWTTRYPASGTGVDESSTTFTIPANISNIRCSLYQTGGMTVLLDIISVSIVQDGTDGIDGTSENLLMDVYVPSLTRVKAPWNRYISNASNSTITGEFIEEANLPDPNATHFFRFTDSSATTHGRGLCFYTNGTPPFINGHTYKIGCWVRKHAGEPQIAVLLGSMSGGFQKKIITNTDWEWIEWVRTFGETDGTIDTHNSTYKRLYFYFYNNNVEGSSLDICGFRLENVQTDISTARNLLFKTEKLTDWGITNEVTIIDGIVTIPEVTANTVRGIYSTKNFNYELIRNQTAIFSVRVKAEANKICGCNLCIGLTSTKDSTTIQKYSNNYIHFTGTDNWQTICIATPINDKYFASGNGTVDYDNCWVAVKIESLGTYHNGFQVKEPQFSLGTTATAWSSAPEDVNENIQQVQDNLDNLEIGGRNLLPFKNCLASIASSLPVTYQGITINKEEDGWIRVSGTRISSTSGSSFPLWINPTGNNYNAPISDNVPQDGNEDNYTLSLEIEGTPFITGDSYTTSTHVVAYGNTSGISVRIGGINGLKDTRVFPTYMSVVRYYIGVNCEGSVDGRFRVKLEKGDKATSWTPAPEDVSADIQQVQDNLDNLEIGGRNLIIGTLNPIATGGTGIYRPHIFGQITNTSGRGTCTVAEHGLRFTNTTANWEYIYFGSSSNTTQPCMLGLEAGKTYTLSADLSWNILSSDTGKANTNTYGMGALLAYSSEANPNDFVTAVRDYPLLITQADKGTDMSGRLVFTFTVPSDAIRLYLGIRANNTAATHYAIGDYLEARNLKLEKGSKATDWTPAPEDVETEITSLEENLKSQIDEKIQTFYQATNPADSWTEDTRSAHDGDLWYYTGDTTTTYTKDNVYRYNASNNTWTVYSASGELFDKIDGKTTIYYGTTSGTYTGVETGDYLVDSTDGSSYRYDGSNWVKVTDYKTGIDAAQASADTANNKIDNLEIGGRNLILDTAIERISPASANNSAYVMPAPMMSDYASGILNNRNDYFTYSFDYEVTGNEASGAYIYVQIRGGSVPSTSDGYYSYVLENPTGKYCCTFKLTEAQATGTYKGCGIRLKNATDGAVLRVWNVKLERGTRATDWTPAPEDAQAEINTALSQSIWYATCDTAGDVLIKEATITPTVDNFTLNVGTTVNVKFENANAGDRNSLKLKINDTEAKDIRYMNNATMVAIPSNEYIIAGGTYLFVYDGTYWVIQNLNYNTNDNYYDRRRHNNAIKAKKAITQYSLIGGNESGYENITASMSFDLGYPILYASAAIKINNTATTTYEAMSAVNFSVTGTIQNGAANKMLWLKGTIRGNTFTVASTNFLTTLIPTSDDGMYYIPLGIMVSATTGYFSSSNRIYAYVDDAFQPLDNAAALTAIQARSEIVQTQETLSLQIRDISIGGANLFEKTKSFEGIANGDNTHDALTEFIYKDLTVRYANTVTFNNSIVELSAYQFTNLTSDTWYTFSFYAKGNVDIGFMYAGSGNAVIDSISVSWNDETYTGFNTTSISSNIIWLTPTDKWQRYNVTFHVEEQDITALHRLIGLYARPVSDNVELITETKDILRTESGTDVHFIMEGNEISICGYKLELGNKPTDWTPSDKDKAGYDNIISQINLSQEGIAIRADKIRFEGMITANEGFSIDEYGNMTANNGTFNGVFESYATEINENTFDLSINNGHIHFYNNDRTLTDDARHVGYIGGIRNSVSYISGEEKINDAIIIRLDNDCDFIIDSQETSGTERVLRVTNHSNNYISVDYWKDLHVYLGKKIQMYGYENNQYPEIIFKRYISDTNQYITRGTLALHSATGTSDINDRLYLYAKNQGDDLAGDQYLYFAGKGLKYSSSGQSLRTGYVATHKYIVTQQFSITDQTITKGSSQNFEIDVTRDGYTPIMCTVTATNGTGAFYLSIYHWTIIGNTVKIFTHNNSTTTDAANITIWVNVLYKLTY